MTYTYLWGFTFCTSNVVQNAVYQNSSHVMFRERWIEKHSAPNSFLTYSMFDVSTAQSDVPPYLFLFFMMYSYGIFFKNEQNNIFYHYIQNQSF